MPRVAPGLISPPVTEIGGTVPNITTGPARPPLSAGWQHFTQEDEHVPELLWPRSLTIYTRMLTHGQVWALYSGMVMPLLLFDWALDANGAEERYAQALADDLGIPLLGPEGWPEASDDLPPIGPGLHRFNFLEHMQEAMFAVALGHYPFEQVAVIDERDGLAHLARLAPRHPLTIEEIEVEANGELRAIRQQGGIGQRTDRAGRPQPIPASALAYYVWWPDARNRWLGRSWLRSMYANHMIHGRLMRVDAINHERAGGVPWVQTDERYAGTDLTQLQAMASLFRVGEDGGAALPPGATLHIERPGGTSVVDSMKYHDEAMARVAHEMVRQLGQTQTGSRALGETQGDIEDMAREALAAWFRTQFRETTIEDWWGWNVPALPDGRRPPHPLLKCRPRKEPSPVPAPGALPAEGGGPPPRAAAARPSPPPPVAAAAPTSRTPARELRREPYPHEVRAATDFAQIDSEYDDAATSAQALLEQVWLPALIAQAVERIAGYGPGATAEELAGLQLEAPDAEPLVEILLAVARNAANGAVDELAAQGLALPAPGEAALRARLAAHAAAVARLVADGVEIAASRKAAQLAGAGAADIGQVADDTGAYLGGLEHRWEADQMAGAVQQAQNGGRFEVFDSVPDGAPVSFHASELLDAATCSECLAVDGREYADLDAAVADYPSGGYRSCKGGPRCRGTVVAVLPGER